MVFTEGVQREVGLGQTELLTVLSNPELTDDEVIQILTENLSPGQFPPRIDIIMDGNGRYAKGHRAEVTAGHEAGANAAERIARGLSRLPVDTLVLWALSPDNIDHRDDIEVAGIMHVIEASVASLLTEVVVQDGRIVHLGDTSRLSASLQARLAEAEEQTKGNLGQTVALAVNYGWQTEQERRQRAILQHAHMADADGHFPASVEQAIYDPKRLGRPALIIRTGSDAEQGNRLSGYPGGEFAQLVFEQTYFPDMTMRHIGLAIVRDFACIEQRKGGRPVKSSARRG